MGLSLQTNAARTSMNSGVMVTDTLNEDLASANTVLINLASNEYQGVKPKALNADVIMPQFKDLKNGQYKMISFFAKKARGVSCYIIDKRITDPEALKAFNGSGYYFSEEHRKDRNGSFCVTRRQRSRGYRRYDSRLKGSNVAASSR